MRQGTVVTIFSFFDILLILYYYYIIIIYYNITIETKLSKNNIRLISK